MLLAWYSRSSSSSEIGRTSERYLISVKNSAVKGTGIGDRGLIASDVPAVERSN